VAESNLFNGGLYSRYDAFEKYFFIGGDIGDRIL
jgi:hypothetical protein